MSAQVKVTIRDTRTASMRELSLEPRWPLVVGCGKDAAIALPDAAELSARVHRKGHHTFVEGCAEDVSVRDEAVSVGQLVRVDTSAFQVGPYAIEVVW